MSDPAFDAFQRNTFQQNAFQIVEKFIIVSDPMPLGFESQIGVWREHDIRRNKPYASRTGKRYRLYRVVRAP